MVRLLMFGLSPLTQLISGGIAGAVVVVGLLWTGNHYGPNAYWRANREAEDRAKNAAIEYLNQHENQVGLEADQRHAKEDAEFAKLQSTLGACPLSDAQAKALNLIGD